MFPNSCLWSWGGTSWDEDENNCDLGKTCSSPGFPGNQIGQTASTICS